MAANCNSDYFHHNLLAQKKSKFASKHPDWHIKNSYFLFISNNGKEYEKEYVYIYIQN